MSIELIREYTEKVEKIVHYGGSKNEMSIRNAFCELLNRYANEKNLLLIPELPVKGLKGKVVTPDGTLKDALRQDWGYWESKDEEDDIEKEIIKKFSKGYPKDNILFEDGNIAILYQRDNEVLRCKFSDFQKLHELISLFFKYERPEISKFRAGIEKFKSEIPNVTKALRDLLDRQKKNKAFMDARLVFIALCQKSINAAITIDDVNEMIIQHILTEDIFNTIFGEMQFHRENSIALELEKVISKFFTGENKKSLLLNIHHYYAIIQAAASQISDHHEKQKFLKIVYEAFYKSYNPLAADRLGVVYTPNEIVNFMIRVSDQVMKKHFDKHLYEKGVEILDPATGTGTFICDLIDYIPKQYLEYKYKYEMHANEVAILPYYIANLNIEYTFQQKAGTYSSFENLCFIDTLENMSFEQRGQQVELFSQFTEENSKRIRSQNQKKIALIIGNPPYNANQENENDDNKNKEYKVIDQRIKDSFIKLSSAKKTKAYDMYSRFFRWAFDRLEDNGVIAFVTNRSYIDKKTFDGFRKYVHKNFQFAYIIDTKSDVRDNGKLSGTIHNVFGIQAGVAIIFLIRKQKGNADKVPCDIRYTSLIDDAHRNDKLQWLSEHDLNNIEFERITPDKQGNWLNITNNDWDKHVPISKIFKNIFPGVNTARDEWVFDKNKENLEKKIKYLIKRYNSLLGSAERFPTDIKWSAGLKTHFSNDLQIPKFDNELIIDFEYRPFTKVYYYAEKMLSDRLTKNHIYAHGQSLKKSNSVIVFNAGGGVQKPFSAFAVSRLTPFQFFVDPTQSAPLYYFDERNKKQLNISDEATALFNEKYKRVISKEDIFYYCFGVLNSSDYTAKYSINLKRDLPKIPLLSNVDSYISFGKSLFGLLSNYENVEESKLKVTKYMLDECDVLLPKFKVIRNEGKIVLDNEITISGIPEKAWLYKIGNRSAIEWIIDQNKPYVSKDKTIADRFTQEYHIENRNEIIRLIKKVCSVAEKRMKIIEKGP